MSQEPPIPSQSEAAEASHREASLDPTDWAGFRAQAHRMLDDMLGYIENIRERPVWQPIPDALLARLFASWASGR
jgi:hypothetical protein